MQFPLDRYRERIGVSACEPNEDSLHQLHNGQAFRIPFENLDVMLGRGIDLTPEAISEKLVTTKRGGYCFELNGLFQVALEASGFTTRRVLARVMYNRPEPGPRTHMATVVEINGKDWLADVGFGGPGMRSPIPIEVDRIEEQFGEKFRIVQNSKFGLTLQKLIGEGWVDLYAFANDIVTDGDIVMSNLFTSSWPESLFRRRAICTMPSPTGRTTLVHDQLTIQNGESIMRETIDLQKGVEEILLHNFGITIDLPASEAFKQHELTLPVTAAIP